MPLKPEDPVGAWVSHYYNSTDPSLDGMSKNARIKMAVAEYQKAQMDRTVRRRAETRSLRKTFDVEPGPRKHAGPRSIKEMMLHFGSGSSRRKEIYRDKAVDILRRSYASLGGYGMTGHGSKEEKELARDDYDKNSVKLEISPARIRKTPQGHKKVPHRVKAVSLYKGQHGLKTIGVGHDGSVDGKKAIRRILSLSKNPKFNIWGEHSGPLQKLMDTMNVPKIHSKHASRLTGKNTTVIDDHTYSRDINGKKHHKTIYGYPDIKDKD